jgi:hypothetical protein
MLSLALVLTLAFAPVPDSIHVLYENKDIEGLKALCDRTENRTEDLMCRYRLYPLTEDADYIADIPTTLDDASARELALLSGLWGYRVAEGSFFQAPRYGTRSNRLMRRAREMNPLEPYVLLINGQSLLYRPSVIGGDKEEAREQFALLCRVAPNNPEAGITNMEAQVWHWYALRLLEKDDANQVHKELLAANPPPLHREFLQDPPDIDEPRS